MPSLSWACAVTSRGPFNIPTEAGGVGVSRDEALPLVLGYGRAIRHGRVEQIAMLSTPEIVERNAQPYAAVAAVVRMDELSAAIDKALPTVFGWLAARGVAPAGAPFFRFRVIDMPSRMEIDFGVPTAGLLEADDAIATGNLPAGHYVSATHTGPYDGLMAATADLLKWIGERHLALDKHKTDLGDAFGCRLEIYHTDPIAEPDPSRFKTELAMRLAD